MIDKKNKNWFTLIEVLIGIFITSIMIIAAFQAFTAILVWKVRLIEDTDIQQESFFFSQKLFEAVKKWWTLDYEEYFNRKVMDSGLTWNSKYLSGHFNEASGFWNFWKDWDVWSDSNNYGNWFYYCLSWNWVWNKMWTGWCVEKNNSDSFFALSGDKNKDYSWEPQRFWQYSFQFVDYNEDYNSDNWDQDSSTDSAHRINWDWDDETLWDAPRLFESGTGITELYLISWDKKRRTFFRWNVKNDPKKPSNIVDCNFSNQKIPTWSGCLWTIEFLKLDWKDSGINHDNLTGSWLYDGLVDTWLIDKKFTWWEVIVAGTGSMDKYWLPLFDDSINVKKFEILAYPNKDRNLAYDALNADMSPYIRVKLLLTPSWKTKTKIKWKVPEFEFNTTINLTDIYSN